MASTSESMVQELCALAAKASSLSQADREQAERRIKQYQESVDKQTGFVQALLQIACSKLPGAVFCSVVLKNTVKHCWNAATAEHCVQEVDKAALHEQIIPCMLMLHDSPAVQRNIAEATTLIADVDFPLAWPGALNLVVQTLDVPADGDGTSRGDDSHVSNHNSSSSSSSSNRNNNNNSNSSSSYNSSSSAGGDGASAAAVVTVPLPVRCAAVATAHSILAKYRTQTEMSEAYVHELRTIYSTLLRPLLRTMALLLDLCERSSDVGEATLACRGLVASVDCLLDMTSLDLGDEFIWSMDTIVTLFLRCLDVHNAVLTLPSSSTSTATTTTTTATTTAQPLIELKTIVTSCVTHFLSNFDEDFEKHAAQFLRVVWGMLADTASQAASMDDLVVRSLELLSSACRGTTRAAFDSHDVVHSLVHQVIVPNLRLRDADVDDYTHEPEVYVQHDIEGSDLHTRRRAAGELLRALVVAVPAVARPLLADEVARVCAAAATDWRAKDLAIYFASSLAIEGQHVDVQRGATQQLSTLVPFDAFLRDMVLPELASPVSATSPLLVKADCIRVVASFRTHVDVALFDTLLACLQAWLASEDYVVVTYAAHALERLLLVPVATPHVTTGASAAASPASSQAVTTTAAAAATQYVVTEAMFAPHAAATLQHLCLAVQRAEHASNAYLVQCLLRIAQRLPGCVTPYLGDVVLSMNAALAVAARNPSSPLFSHCLFEVLSRCIAMSPAHGAAIEHALWDSLVYILANDVTEYVPYALQILAQLLRTRARVDAGDTSVNNSNKGAAGGGGDNNNTAASSAAPPSAYQALLQPLLEPGMYEQRGNIPAIVCLLTAFVECYPGFVHAQGATGKLLNVVAHLIRQKNYDHEGLNLLTTMLLHYPAAVMDTYLTQILRLIVERLQRARTAKYVRIVILFVSVLVLVRGPAAVVRHLNEVQGDLFLMFLQRVWLPNVQKITGDVERKTCIVALARLLCESAELQASEGGVTWANSVYSCLRMIHAEAEQDDHVSFAPHTRTLHDLAAQHRQRQLEETGYTNSFVPLQAAALKPVDVCADVHNAELYFRQSMTELLRGRGASLIAVLQSSLTPDLLALIQ